MSLGAGDAEVLDPETTRLAQAAEHASVHGLPLALDGVLSREDHPLVDRLDASALRQRTLALCRESGFREHYSSRTGEGSGARDFTWSAALALDLR